MSKTWNNFFGGEPKSLCAAYDVEIFPLETRFISYDIWLIRTTLDTRFEWNRCKSGKNGELRFWVELKRWAWIVCATQCVYTATFMRSLFKHAEDIIMQLFWAFLPSLRSLSLAHYSVHYERFTNQLTCTNELRSQLHKRREKTNERESTARIYAMYTDVTSSLQSGS